jgi:chitodextrinase
LYEVMIMGPRSSWWTRIFGGLIGIGLLLGPPAAAVAGSASLSWDPNTEQDFAGYQLYYGPSSGSYQFTVDVGNQTTYTLSGLTDGQTYYFAVTAYDTSGNESNFSSEVSTTISGIPPPPPSALPIPGPIEVEDYTQGGEGVGYHDTTAGNSGGACRTDDVDIKNVAGEGCTVGWVDGGEWLKYDVAVQQTGTYDLSFRIARGVSGQGTFHLELDGQDITGPISVPSTGSWLTQTNVTVSNVSLPQGNHTLRLFFDTNHVDVNWMKFTLTSTAPPPSPDTQAPSTPTNLTALAVSSSQINLSWSASTDNVGVTGYKIFRDGTQITTVATSSYADTGLSPSTTYSYTVAAFDAAGNTSAQSSPASGTTLPAPDTPPPTVSISAPANTATVFGSSVTVSASASDNVGVVGVQFRVDGADLGAEDTTNAYSVAWDSTTATDGAHTLTAVARDAAGNTTTSSSVSVTVDNVTPASLTVRTLPGTRIFLGGNYAYLGVLQGTVPQTGELQISGLLPGRHILRASMAGFMDAYRVVTLLPGPNVLPLNLVLFDPLATLNPTFTVLEAGGPIVGGGGASVPFVVDWDNDGNKDLLLAGGDGSIALYQNVGTDAAPQFSGSTPIMADGTAIAVPGPSFVFVVDWDGDEN